MVNVDLRAALPKKETAHIGHIRHLRAVLNSRKRTSGERIIFPINAGRSRNAFRLFGDGFEVLQ
jgi:hypothetical protein